MFSIFDKALHLSHTYCNYYIVYIVHYKVAHSLTLI